MKFILLLKERSTIFFNIFVKEGKRIYIYIYFNIGGKYNLSVFQDIIVIYFILFFVQ
jgi:hypothetical protein